jgi:hypothetical protein
MFNQTAIFENQLKKSIGGSSRLSQVNEEGILLNTGVNAGYASVINSLNSLDTEEINDLKQEKLWGVALTLKALAYYRLGDIDELNKVVTDAGNLKPEETFSRDKASIIAMPGLIRINQANRVIKLSVPTDPTEKSDRMKEVKDLLQNGIEILDETRQKNTTHPIKYF